MTPDAKDVITAILGASVSLAGLLLVFGGFVFAKAETFPREHTPDATIENFRKAGRLSFWPFLVSLLVAGIALSWLIFRIACLFWMTIGAFAILLIGTATHAGTFILLSQTKKNQPGKPVRVVMRNQRCDLPAGRQAGSGDPAEIRFA